MSARKFQLWPDKKTTDLLRWLASLEQQQPWFMLPEPHSIAAGIRRDLELRGVHKDVVEVAVVLYRESDRKADSDAILEAAQKLAQ